MADPLSQLRQFYINQDLKKIEEYNGYIIFGDHGWPKNVNTNYLVYSTDDDRNKKEYYTLECLLYFLKNMELAHHHYVKQAGRDSVPVVHRPDRKNLLAYLKGEQQTSSGIDKNAPIPSLRLSAAEIYNVGGGSSSQDPQPSTSSNQHDSSRGEPARGASKKRPHDPEMEKKFREEFAARLNEPSAKKIATIIPTDSVDKAGETAEGSAAISKFGAEKLAALRAKHLAVKRTTIIDADEVTKIGSGASDSSNKEAELLIAMDSDPSKLIKSKEKIWRNRFSILRSQSKSFGDVIKLVDAIMHPEKNPQSNKKGPGQMPPVPADMQMNPYHHQQQQQQTAQRNAYNRYDQERFVKLDIGVEIDTKKSFVSGVANGLSAYNSQTQQVTNNQNNGGRGPPNNHHNQPQPPNHHHHRHQPGQRPIEIVDPLRRIPNSKPSKRTSQVPIIIIPATTTSLINMYNASAILQDLTYVEGATNKTRDSEIMIQRTKPDGSSAFFKILDNPVRLDTEDWNRVVAVFVQGPAWQFKGWPWGGSPVEIFSRIKGFHLKWDEAKLDDNVAKWNVHILELSRSKRHLDKANLLKFWSSLETYMTKYKSFLKF